ncbi:MAG: hypothetical protein LBC03_02840 [Nitrososphaerota archaeon]|nr:hypothetical protein [Nitrososphaerota archaeon]
MFFADLKYFRNTASTDLNLSRAQKSIGVISCDAGMSRDACLFAVNHWFELVEGKLGFCLMIWWSLRGA